MDFAQLACFGIPLRPGPKGAEASGFTSIPDYAARLRIICAYAGVAPEGLVEVLLDLQACERQRTINWGEAGIYPFDSFLERSFVEEIEAESRFVRELGF